MKMQDQGMESTNTGTATGSSRVVYLRVRRRADDDQPAPNTLKLEMGSKKRKKKLEDALNDMDLHKTTTRKRRTAIWKRVDAKDKNENDNSNANKRLVTAVLEDDNEKSVVKSASENQKKRRKLAILEETTTTNADDWTSLFKDPKKPKKKKGPYKVLNPLQRMVDDSLKQVFIGELMVEQHLQFIRYDPNLMGATWCWTWTNVEMGNIFHACALWDALEITNELLLQLGDSDKQTMVSATDASGHTPYDTARLSGHDSVCQALAAFGADVSALYQYDVYCLQEAGIDEGNGDGEIGDGDSDSDAMDADVVCELQNGQAGYWNENGELVLELYNEGERLFSMTDEDEDNEDDDEDSNKESWNGNDYPEDDVWPSDDDDSAVDQTFRNRPMMGFSDDDSGDYDASYGIYNQRDTEYDDEC